MIYFNKHVTIQLKLNPTVFEVINAQVYAMAGRRIGTPIKAVQTLINKTEMLKNVLPVVIGSTPESNASNWDSAVSEYVNSISVEIPTSGYKLDLSFNLLNNDKQLAVAKAIFKTKDETIELTEAALAKKVIEKVDILDMWKYGTPVDAANYVLYQYCQNYGAVANTIADINKSPNIKFYIHDEAQVKAAKSERHKIETDALAMYITVIKDKESDVIVEDLLYAIDGRTGKYNSFDKADKEQALMDLVRSIPEEFVRHAAKSDTIKIKAFANKLIAYGIVKKADFYDIYTEAKNPTIVLGNTYDEYLTFLSNDRNKAKVQEFESVLKNLK